MGPRPKPLARIVRTFDVIPTSSGRALSFRAFQVNGRVFFEVASLTPEQKEYCVRIPKEHVARLIVAAEEHLRIEAEEARP
jgi:hypothetical protein